MSSGGDQAVKVDQWQDGAVFYVKAHPASRREGIAGVHDGMLKVNIAAAPEKGKANKAILKLLAKALAIPPNSLELVSGETQSRKKIAVSGFTADEIREKLYKVL